MKKFNIKWINRYSSECGYIGKVLKSKGYFVNSPSKEKAKKYASVKAAKKEIFLLNQLEPESENDYLVEEM